MTERSLGRISVTPVDVESVLVEYLRDTLNMKVSTKYPKDITPENVEPFIVLSTVSSTIKNVVVQRTILHVDCFAGSTVDAFDLAAKTAALLTSYNRVHCRIEQEPIPIGRTIDTTCACCALQVAVTVKARTTEFQRSTDLVS